ncbi:MAG: hypothetical protein WCO88_01190 [Actinomycetota bacterium]|jgi:hypothetical protein
MVKRLVWFVGGIAAGVLGMGAAKKKVKTVANELAPVQVVKRTGRSLRSGVDHIGDAVREGKRAMSAKETELRARRDGRLSTLTDEIGDVDTVFVDGLPVEPGQVIVLRQMPDKNAAQPRARRRA